MSRKASRNATPKQRDERAASPVAARAPAAERATSGSVRGPRRWVVRAALMVLVPLLLLGFLEGGLRLCGYGYPTSFFVKMEDGLNYTANRSFGWQFFSRETSTYPHPFVMPIHKSPDTFRVFILGESAALGTPAPAFGFGRILEVMLRQRFPNKRIEVINAAMRGIDSNIVLPIARECARHQPDLFIIYMGNNEAIGLYSPEPNSRNFTSRRLLLRTGQRLKATKLCQLFESAWHRLHHPARKTQDMEFFRQHRFAADAPGKELIYANFQANLEEICRVTRASGAKVIVSTVGANLKDFPPLGSLHRTGLNEAAKTTWESAWATGIAAEAAGQQETALRSYGEAVRIDDHFAELQFRLGRVCLATGQFQAAQEHYRLSRDWDALQFRTDSRLNRIIRDTAGRKQAAGIRLVDGEQEFGLSPLSDHQIPGSPLFNDHAHMSFEGDYVLARAFFPAVVSALNPANSPEPANATLPSRVECAERLGFTSWEEVSVAAGMLRSLDKPPFLEQLEHRERLARDQETLQQRLRVVSQPEQLEQARAAYRAAIARDPGDWQLHFTFANFLSQINDPTAVEEFRMVVNIFPKLQPMRLALANALLSAGRRYEALDQFAEVLRFDPDCAPAKAAISRVRAGR